MLEPLNVEAFIEAAPWWFAKTMPHIPHEYVVRGRDVTDDQFEAFVQHIREHGYKARWGRHLNTYLNVGEHKYWRIGVIINRAAVDRI